MLLKNRHLLKLPKQLEQRTQTPLKPTINNKPHQTRPRKKRMPLRKMRKNNEQIRKTPTMLGTLHRIPTRKTIKKNTRIRGDEKWAI